MLAWPARIHRFALRHQIIASRKAVPNVLRVMAESRWLGASRPEALPPLRCPACRSTAVDVCKLDVPRNCIVDEPCQKPILTPPRTIGEARF